MRPLKFVPIPPEPLDRYEPLLGDDFPRIRRLAEWSRECLRGRAIWHISSTARGGGVAEMLRTMLPYVRGAGVDTRWAVLREAAEFFEVTKRIHNRLHGDPGDGGPLGERERHVYESALAARGEEIAGLCQHGDLVYLHDPQTAGLVPAMKDAGLCVLWRCHIGVDEPNQIARDTWDFLRGYLEPADGYVFSRRQYLWDGLEESKAWFMPPVIDPFTPKNQELEPASVDAILRAIGLAADGLDGAPSFIRGDGTPGRVERRAALLQEQPLPTDAKVVVQVSRWDRLKDPHGMLEILERHLDDPNVHLVLAGPETEGVADDPEGKIVYGDVAESWRRMSPEPRRRAHLASLPMFDLDENGAMVNALQRRADVVVQKSIAEGFGLTVAEAMWKARPVVASGVGGIRDQVLDGETGFLVDDPGDYAAFAARITELLAEPERARRMGEAGRERVIEEFLAVRRLREYVVLVAELLGLPEPPDHLGARSAANSRAGR